jgi:hypothetical protein
MVIDKIKFTSTGVGPGKFGAQTGLLDMELTLKGLHGLGFDISGTLAIQKKKPPGSCQHWCTKHISAWSEKCAWDTGDCASCSQCKDVKKKNVNTTEPTVQLIDDGTAMSHLKMKEYSHLLDDNDSIVTEEAELQTGSAPEQPFGRKLLGAKSAQEDLDTVASAFRTDTAPKKSQWGFVRTDLNFANLTKSSAPKLKTPPTTCKNMDVNPHISVHIRDSHKIVQHYKVQLGFDLEKVIGNFKKIMDGELKPDEKKQRLLSAMFGFDSTFKPGSISSKTSVYYMALFMEALELKADVQFHEFEVGLARIATTVTNLEDVDKSFRAVISSAIQKDVTKTTQTFLTGKFSTWFADVFSTITKANLMATGINITSSPDMKKAQAMVQAAHSGYDAVQLQTLASSINVETNVWHHDYSNCSFIPFTKKVMQGALVSKAEKGRSDPLWDFLMSTKAGKTTPPLIIKGIEWIEAIRDALLWVWEQLKKTGLVDVAMKAFNNAKTAAEKVDYAKQLQRLLNGRVTFTELASAAMTAIGKAIEAPLLDWLNTNLAAILESVEEFCLGLLLKVAAFIAEEILSEPFPFTMWGMEAIGAGISELVKVAWTYVQNWSAWVLGKVSNWIAKGVVKVLVWLPDFGANALSGVLDEHLLPVMTGAVNAIKDFASMLKEILSHIPKPILKLITICAKWIYETVMANVAPFIRDGVNWAKNFLQYIHQACNYATEGACDLGLAEEDAAEISLEEVTAQLKDAHRHAPRQPLQELIQPFEKFQYHVPEPELHQFFTERAKKEEAAAKRGMAPSQKLTLVEIFRDIQTQGHEKGMLKPKSNVLTIKEARNLVDFSEQQRKMQTDISAVQTQLQDLGSQMGLDQTYHTELLSRVATISRELAHGEQALVQVDWLKAIGDFFRKNMAMIKCTFTESVELLKNLHGKLSQQGLLAVVEDDIKKMMGAAKTTFDFAVQNLEKDLKEDVLKSSQNRSLSSNVSSLW